jgi:hypothetical protein
MDPVTEPDEGEDLAADQCALLGCHSPGHRGKVHVLLRGQLGDECIVLEHVPQTSQPELRPGTLVECPDIHAVYEDRSAGGTVEKPEHVKER